jgi:thiamine biosynthesis lipoprotein
MNVLISGPTDEDQPMLTQSLSRRRMIVIAASAAGSALLASSRFAHANAPVRWHGSALGAQVSIEIHHPDSAEAERLVERCVLEVRRLEQQFSLYRADSAISILNRTGILVAPDADMVALLRTSLRFAEITSGAFDPTVQPLWQLHADHFSSGKPGSDGPSPQQLAEALAKVGHAGLLVSENRVALLRSGAAITLNGIAQGFATDRVVERLRRASLSTTLVNMGEIRAIGARPEGTPWRVGLGDPDRPGVLTETVDLVDRAVATSAGAGFRFDSTGRFTHLFDPTTGRSPSRYSTVSVIAPTATEADALSTAFSLMPLSRIQDIVAVRPNVQVRIVDSGGTLIVYGA